MPKIHASILRLKALRMLTEEQRMPKTELLARARRMPRPSVGRICCVDWMQHKHGEGPNDEYNFFQTMKKLEIRFPCRFATVIAVLRFLPPAFRTVTCRNTIQYPKAKRDVMTMGSDQHDGWYSVAMQE